jgi:hypothetical protein
MKEMNEWTRGMKGRETRGRMKQRGMNEETSYVTKREGCRAEKYT